MKKILGMGSALVDVLIRLDSESPLQQLALPKGSMQLVDRAQSEKVLRFFSGYAKSLAAGGSAANTVHGIGMLGGRAGFIGMLGSDELGSSFIEDMERAGVELFLSTGEAPTGCAITLISPDSERTFATYLGAAAELSVKHLRPALFSGFDIFHIEGYLVFNQELAESAIRTAREAGLTVSIDLASYNVVEANRDFLERVIRQYVDIVFANEEEARAFTGRKPEEAAAVLGGMTQFAIVKTGAKGSLVRHGGETLRIGTIPVNPVDTTGAGDLYAAGFLYGLASDLPLNRCGELGALLAGNVIEVVGPKMEAGVWERIKKVTG